MKTITIKEYIFMGCTAIILSMLVVVIVSTCTYDSPLNKRKLLGAYIVSKY